MRRPNLFIVGAPKCGTTALYAYLQTHPNIFMCPVKEPNFFADDLPGCHKVASLDEYLQLFARATETHHVLGEASVFHLYSQVAIENIHRFNREAKYIAMLRNPIELVHSFHAQSVFNLEEPETDFERAWRLEPLRKQGKHVPRECPDPPRLYYSELGKLGEQVQRLLSIVPREQVLLILFEDFRSSTRDVYETVLRFLDVPSDGRTEFPPVNESKTNRSQRVARWLREPPWPIGPLVERTKRALGIRTSGVGIWLRRLNARRQKRPPLSAAMRRELADAFRDDVALLSDLTGRDLTHWLEAPETAGKSA